MPPTGVPAGRSRVWIISVSALVLYLLDSLIRHARFHTGFDLTIFDQAINQYAHLHAPDVLVKSQQPFNILGDHFHPILVLLAPFYRIWPDARLLLVAQAVLMALGVHLLARLAVRRLGRFGYAVGAAFALSWGILQAVDFDFHEIAFAVPLLVLAFEALQDGRFARLLVFSGLLMLVKEDSPLLVIGLALVMVTRRKLRQALLLGAFGALGFVVIVFVVIPHFSYSHTYLYLGYAGSGSSGVLGLITTGLGTVFSLRGVVFLGALALTAGLGLRSPLVLAILPTLGARVVSSQLAYTGFLYHYNATLMVICFLALCDGIARQRLSTATAAGRWLRAQTVLLVGVAAVSVIRAPTVPSIASVFASCARCTAAQQAVDRIPDGARVAADVFLMPHLVDRTQVMQAYPGFVDTTGLPLRADWVILDTDSTSYAPGPLTARADQLGWSRRLENMLVTSGRFTVVDRFGQYAVLRSVG